jgi:hypothetical protein
VFLRPEEVTDMIKKLALVLVLVAGGMLASAPPAAAGTSVHISVGLPGFGYSVRPAPVYYYPAPAVVGFAFGYAPPVAVWSPPPGPCHDRPGYGGWGRGFYRPGGGPVGYRWR